MATNKFKFSFKITGLEIEVEGTKEDVAAITSNVSNQLRSLTQIPAITEGTDSPTTVNGSAEVVGTDIQQNRGSKKRSPVRKQRSESSLDSSSKPESSAIDTRFDSTKFGAPKMEWSTLQKVLWILYVVKEEANISEVSGYQIEITFNKHFRQAKAVSRANVYRDLGKAKIANPALVGEDKAKTPAKWYLTDAGIKYVQDLIAKQLHGTRTEAGAN